MSEPPTPPRGPIIAVALVVCAVCAVAVKSCGGDDGKPTVNADPLPPAPPPLMSVPPLEPASALGGRDKPRLSKTTMKRYRLETCYFGATGVPYARESYWKSLGPELPSALNVPSFGDYPEHQPRTPGGRLPVAATIGRLPFEQHLRACTSAKTLKGSDDYDAIAPALERYEKHVAEVTRTLSDAARYYARSEHSRDQFKKGMELHQKISDDLADFETAHAAYGKALRAWYPTLGPLADEAELDQGGKLAKRAVAEARTLTHLMLADPREQAAIDRALAATTKAGEALATHGRADASAPHPRTVGRQLETYLEVATAVARVAPAGASERYQIGYAMAQLLDAEQRALAQLLGGDDDDAFGARLRPLAPLAKPKHAPR